MSWMRYGSGIIEKKIQVYSHYSMYINYGEYGKR